jgi:hypothetical protein
MMPTTAQHPGERGSLLPLIAGLMALVIALVFVVVSATSLAIERHRLHALAEATALFASESFDPAALRMGSGELVVPLTSGGVRREAIRYLSSVDHRHLELSLVAADTPDSRRARVWLAATWRPPFVSAYVPVSLRVDAQARSRVMIR